jgi:hypothetical protein
MQAAKLATETAQHVDAEKARKENLKHLREREANLEVELKATQKLLAEGNSRLTDALKAKDQASISVAQSILQTAAAKMTKCQAQLSAVMKELCHSKTSKDSLHCPRSPPAKKKKTE